MMSAANLVFLVTIAGALVLALRGLRTHGLSFRNKAWMAAAWALIIAALAFFMANLPQPRPY